MTATYWAPIYVRYVSGTYRATCEGRSASCTAGEAPAAKACARKKFGYRLIQVKEVNSALFMAEVTERRVQS
jgi:hypothetical protein